MKSIIRKILIEETKKTNLSDVILKDLKKTFSKEYLKLINGEKGLEMTVNQYETAVNTSKNLLIPHIESTYDMDIVDDRSTIIPILNKWVRYIYNPKYPLIGDVVEMVEMVDDPNPIVPGIKGVVEDIRSIRFNNQYEEHVDVKWENGRTLNLILPYDKIKIVSDNSYHPMIVENKIEDFIDFTKVDLDLDDNFTVDITNDTDEVETLASYDINNNEVTVLGKDRSLPDIIRSVAHELVHHKQNERGELTGRQEEGEDGSPWEDEANAKAGEIVRKFGSENPEIYDL